MDLLQKYDYFFSKSLKHSTSHSVLHLRRPMDSLRECGHPVTHLITAQMFKEGLYYWVAKQVCEIHL